MRRSRQGQHLRRWQRKCPLMPAAAAALPAATVVGSAAQRAASSAAVAAAPRARMTVARGLRLVSESRINACAHRKRLEWAKQRLAVTPLVGRGQRTGGLSLARRSSWAVVRPTGIQWSPEPVQHVIEFKPTHKITPRARKAASPQLKTSSPPPPTPPPLCTRPQRTHAQPWRSGGDSSPLIPRSVTWPPRDVT